MASISRDAGGKRRILFVAPDEKRKAIRLGKVSQRNAEQVKFRVERLLEAKLTGHAIDADTARWIADLDARMADRLARVRLIPKRKKADDDDLGPFLADYIERRIDVKPATKVVWEHVAGNLNDHFGRDRQIQSVNEGDAEDFKLYLIADGLAPTTIHKRLQVARMFFRSAWKRKLTDINPFAEVSAKSVIREDRRRFITADEYKQLIEACNPTWKVIVALCRYGGLRCPSEVLSLKWDDVNWETERIVVQSPKTEHHPGKGNRTIPLFPELKTVLLEAAEIAPDRAEYVVGGNYRKAANSPTGWKNCNLRTQFERIVKRAGLTPWPRLFHAMRASRETELAKAYPIHVVTAWLGNTPKIALRHYLMVTNDDFEKATECGAESGAQVAQNAAQQAHAASRTDSQETKQALAEQGLVRDRATGGEVMPNVEVAGTGFEPATSRL